MPRGRVLRTKVRDAKALAAATIEGQQIAERKKPWEISMKEHLGKIIDRIDPLEAAAMFAMTLLIHDTYDWTASVLTGEHKKTGTNILGLTRRIGTSTIVSGLGHFLDNVPDPMIWLVSFLVSFYILRHGKEITTAVPQVLGMLGLIA